MFVCVCVCVFVCLCVCLCVCPPLGLGLGLVRAYQNLRKPSLLSPFIPSKTFASFTFLTTELLLSYQKLGPHYLYVPYFLPHYLYVPYFLSHNPMVFPPRFFPRKAYQNLRFFHLSYHRPTTIFLPERLIKTFASFTFLTIESLLS